MNRLKVWLFVLLVGAAAVAAARFAVVVGRDGALRTLDARLNVAAARFAGAVRTVSNETAAVAALAAREPKLIELLHAKEAAPARGHKPSAPPADPAADEAVIQTAARAAVTSAEKAAGFALPETTQILSGNREWLARKSQEAAASEKELVGILGTAIGGERWQGWVRWSEKLWYGAALPAGEGAGLLLLVPIDSGWVQAVASGSGADLTLVAEGQKPMTSVRSGEADVIAAAASHAGGTPRDAGRLAPSAVNVLGVRVAKPGLIFLAGAPAYRAMAVAVPGLAGGRAVVSTAVAPLLVPALELEWTVLAGTLAIVLIGFLFGLLVRPTEVAAPVPPELVAVADKIARGDFTARAPVLAGKLGTVANALNRAADAATAAASASSGAIAPSLTQEFFAGSEKAAAAPSVGSEPEPSGFDFPRRSPPARTPPAAEPAPAARADSPALGGGAFEAAPIPAPRPPAVIAPPPPPVAATTDLLQAAARAAPPADAGGDEQHWREVFQDFLRVRTECGEPAEGLTFERFRAKLESNKATLVAKYACRTVRFQVYVKEGKAALKATPVR